MTERQREIVRRIVLGDAVGIVAKDLGVRSQTVRRHLTAVYDETCTWSQAQLVGWCVAHGFVSVADLQAVYAAGTQQETDGEVAARPVR